MCKFRISNQHNIVMSAINLNKHRRVYDETGFEHRSDGAVFTHLHEC